jgi:hypothetical protein
MTRRRTIIFIVGLLAVLAGACSDAALGSSLLSGYGGPGQGSQALLGSAMLNGGGGGGGGGGEGGSAGAATSPASSTPLTVAASSAGAARTSSGGHRARSRGRTGPAPTRSRARPSGAQPTAQTRISDVYAAAERGRSAPSTGLLGLSATDLLLIVLVLCILGFTGVLTRRLTRASPAGTHR